MATTTQTYSGMLAVQADMAFPFERSFFEHPSWQTSMVIGDFGSGNCAYAAKLHDRYPGKKFVCMETNSEMRQLAQSYVEGREIGVLESEHSISDAPLDFLILRLVLLHLSDRTLAYSLARRSIKDGGALLVIDAEDEHFFISPPQTLFLEALSELRSKSNDRNLRTRLDGELASSHFAPVLHHSFVINSDGSLAKLQMYLYMKLTAEQARDGVRNDKIEDELITWYLDPKSYAQYGVFGTLYLRSK